MKAPDQRLRPPASSPANFVDTLARVLGRARQVEGNSEFLVKFREELQALPPESQARLSVLLNLGREAHSSTLPAPSSQDTAALDALALCEADTLSRMYLERGWAAACAGKLTLDTSAQKTFETGQRVSVSERAWSRFGRELASSEPGEWSWFACYKGRTRVLDKLYVRHGNSAWWSFATSLDRPLREQIDADRRRATSGGQNRQGSSLESLLTQEGTPSRRALQRALTSVHARLGKVRRGANDPA